MKQKLSPKNANTTKKLCKLNKDSFDTKGYWIMIQETKVTIVAQHAGHTPTQEIRIPRKDFNKLLNWYLREQKVK